MALLTRLGAVTTAGDRLEVTPLGRRLQRWPVPVRLARMLAEGRGAPNVAAACALLAEGTARGPNGTTTTCDLLTDLDRFAAQPLHVRQVARELVRLAQATLDDALSTDLPEAGLRRALFAGFADRLARRRGGAGERLTLASGHGAVLARESGVRDGEFLVALEVRGAESRGVAEARVLLASAVDGEWIAPTAVAVEHAVDPRTGQVRAHRVERYDALVLSETPVAIDPAIAAVILAEAWLAREPAAADAELLRRLRFAGLELDVSAVVQQAAATARRVDDIRLVTGLSRETAAALDRLAPTSLAVPSGRQALLSYADDGSVTASVKLQEVFGLAETPRLGPARVPVTFRLLAPNARPVQTTRDLRSFWQRTYPEVRKELRGRYPRHPWPDDPWTATPTHRTTRNARK